MTPGRELIESEDNPFRVDKRIKGEIYGEYSSPRDRVGIGSLDSRHTDAERGLNDGDGFGRIEVQGLRGHRHWWYQRQVVQRIGVGWSEGRGGPGQQHFRPVPVIDVVI